MKTGTTSLGKAYEILGFKHMGWNPALHAEWKQDRLENIFNTIDEYEAFEDGPWRNIDFMLLDSRYPNSKFILLERDNDSWIKSLEYHCSPKYNVNEVTPQYLDVQWIENRSAQIERELEYKERKYKTVKEYFRNRPDDLLVMNISEGWTPLCNFLGCPQPTCPFPKINVSHTVRK